MSLLRRLCLLALCLGPLPATAGSLVAGGASILPGDNGGGDGEGARLSISQADCARLTGYSPAADVAYQPGVDVHGNRVAPADIGGSRSWTMPDEIVINLESELAGKYGIPTTGGLYSGTVPLGQVVVKGGRAYVNDQPVTDEDQHDLAIACQKQGN